MHKTLYIFRSPLTSKLSCEPHKNPMSSLWPMSGTSEVIKIVFFWVEPSQPHPYTKSDCKLHRKDNTNAPAGGRGINVPLQPEHSPIPTPTLPLISPAKAGAFLGSIRADKAPSPNPISCGSQRCCLSQWPDAGWSAQQQGAADVLSNTSWSKETAFWGILGFLCGGVETHIFLTRERAACFPVRACVSDQLSLLLFMLLLLYS